jgi:hypothetical protein
MIAEGRDGKKISGQTGQRYAIRARRLSGSSTFTSGFVTQEVQVASNGVTRDAELGREVRAVGWWY